MIAAIDILKKTGTISNKYKELAKSTGENFNIFSILRMESNEVTTHSRFIAELLNPNGSHDQSDKFLAIFKNTFAPESKLNLATTKVYVEHYVGKVEAESGGRIDILIKDAEGNVIMIENKVYAAEQSNQLLRYHNAFPSGKLIYLTLFGEKSREENSAGLYETMSYETDMVNWLEQCLVKVENMPVIQQTIIQYINVIKKLTNQSLNNKMSQEIINKILEEKEYLTAYKVLYDVNNELKKELVTRILGKIQEMLSKKGIEDVKTMDCGVTQGTLFHIQTASMKKNHIKLALYFEGKEYSRLNMGFVKTNSNISLDPDKLHQGFKKVFSESKQSDQWLAYIEYTEYRDFYYHTLNKIYFDKDFGFYRDLEDKIDRMMEIYHKTVELTYEPIKIFDQ
ncbi:MAG: PD-(D/E)XK nuclease family protein [Allomuricauda sp.]|uniref:PD-(D/E)XK nuclease family protein n=1 Tax=Flagellimonas oceani TaxID=2698672 RepID=A0A6G7J7E2_9FLAO|nr:MULTISPECIES: PD-(D/E)XK nuclease family protein [Allomuricauda]MBW8241886.1 PD-(D/E)XK nuclease family protein [Allomuricauda oceani]QII46801.1 PD-(D/E)XK nuclease family protein [Allomuricauda oceani]